MAASQSSRSKSTASPPVWSRKMWTGTANVEVAVFTKEMHAGQESAYTAYNVSAKRTYKEGDIYKNVQGFRSEDIPVLIQLLTQAHAFICDKMNE